MEYEFTLKYRLAADVGDADALVERLGAAGCDDALIGIGQPGRIALDFSREGRSARAAIVSAMMAVKKAIPMARLVEVSPDSVGLTDIAELVGVSRQNMRQLSLAHADSFPAPFHSGNVALWHLAHVLQWLAERRAYRIDKSLLDVALVAMQINLVKESTQIESDVRREVRHLVA
jgi:predicted DNA-binding transcriptional regulator AlpA